MLLRLGGLVQQLEHERVQRRPARDHRTRAERVLGDLPGSTPGGRWRTSVDHDRDVGVVRERARARAGEGDLLLDHREREHVAGRAAGLGDEPRGLQRDVAAPTRLSSERETTRLVAEARPARASITRDVADADQLAGLVAVLGADVDVQVVQLGDLLALLVARAGGSASADRRPGSSPSRVATSTRWPTQDLRVPAADALEAQEAVVVDVCDDQADLVDVPDDREPGMAPRSRAGDPRHR